MDCVCEFVAAASGGELEDDLFDKGVDDEADEEEELEELEELGELVERDERLIWDEEDCALFF